MLSSGRKVREEPGSREWGQVPTADTPAVAWGLLISWEGQLEPHTEKGSIAVAKVGVGGQLFITSESFGRLWGRKLKRQ